VKRVGGVFVEVPCSIPAILQRVCTQN